MLDSRSEFFAVVVVVVYATLLDVCARLPTHSVVVVVVVVVDAATAWDWQRITSGASSLTPLHVRVLMCASSRVH